MREIEPKFELFDIAQAGAGNWIVGDGAGTEIARLGGNPGDRERIQKYREQSQNVDENKAHHFFVGGKSGAFGAPIGKNQALKGARAIWGNEVRLDRRKARQRRDNLSARQDRGLSATTCQK
jgi:hypothetical protein